MKNVTERHVQAIWYDAAFRPQNLVTRRGSEVHVISPGEWNLGPGPDFRHAVLEVGKERRRLVGDVEIHLAPADWDFHGHGTDPRYRNVVAHVTWGCGEVPNTLPPGAISIWIGRFLASAPGFSPEQIDLMAYPYARLPETERPCAATYAENPEAARKLLTAAGRHRLRMKSRRLLARVAEIVHETDIPSSRVRKQVYYEEVMTALGYSKNARQFRRVAERVPVSELTDETEVVRTMLLTAGSFEVWDRTGCRPENSPERRLSQAASVFTQTPIMDMSDQAVFGHEVCRDLIRQMCEGAAETRGGRCMGRGRAGAILANVIVPWAMAEGRITEAPEWLPPEDVSEPVRLTAFRLFGRDHNPAVHYATNGLLIQGLLQIHRDYCLQVHPDCQECALAHNGPRR